MTLRETLQANVNRFLANAATDAGFDYARADIPGTVAELAPGWAYKDTTVAGALHPRVELTVPTYHDVHITTPTIERVSIFNLPYRVIVQCTRCGGWDVWARAEGSLPEQNLAVDGVRIDVAGHVIYDTLTPQE